MVNNTDSIANRLKTALAIRDMRQQDLVERTKIPKGSISQYVTGYVEPKSDRIYLMAKALDVNPVWLMGLDAPMTLDKKEWSFIVSSHGEEALIPDDFVIEYMQASQPIREQIKAYAEFLMKRDGDNK